MAIVYQLLEDGSGVKIDANGHPLVFDDEKDKEFGLDAISLYSKIPALQAEAKKYREGFANLEPNDVHEKLTAYAEQSERLRAFGDLDPEKAKEAIATMQNLDQLDKERNIEIEKIKAGVSEAYKSKIKDIDESYTRKVGALEEAIYNKDSAIRDLLIRGAFDRSEFIKEQTVLPSDLAYSYFGKHFKIEEDNGRLKVFALDSKGDKIFSLSKPGDPATPEEAIEVLINEYPQKDNILRTTSGGAGSTGNTTTGASDRAKREALKLMNPTERLSALRRG